MLEALLKVQFNSWEDHLHHIYYIFYLNEADILNWSKLNLTKPLIVCWSDVMRDWLLCWSFTPQFQINSYSSFVVCIVCISQDQTVSCFCWFNPENLHSLSHPWLLYSVECQHYGQSFVIHLVIFRIYICTTLLSWSTADLSCWLIGGWLEDVSFPVHKKKTWTGLKTMII